MKTWIKIILGLILVGIIGALLVYFFVYNKPHPDYENLKPDFTVTAQTLFDAFVTDNVAAQQKYNGKMIEVKGSFTRMEASDSLNTIVFVFKQGDFGDEGIRCSVLAKYNETAQKLTPGSAIKVKGYCTGFTGDVILEQCSLEK